MQIEEHPLEPFLPANANVLFLGSFPPPKARWSMEFFYPNWINDFWRIQGLIHFNDKQHFEADNEKRFDKDRIIAFCREKGVALFDTARKVRRLKDNADDNFLEIVEGTDVFALLEQMPECRTIVTTGGKASEELQGYFELHSIKVNIPKVGECVELPNDLRWWRMPSSSRAYPMKIEKKAEYYRLLVMSSPTGTSK
ncbi:MAG: uracil-DNA glycosylase family protein [Bacteroidaceae bacterium]|nr:uracil-DNA glycosylase family protein [Bacteroidaceae bacterium]